MTDMTDTTDDPYSIHNESDWLGGNEYIRCEECGAEHVPASDESLNPAHIVHRDGCPESSQVGLMMDWTTE